MNDLVLKGRRKLIPRESIPGVLENY